MIVTQKEQSKIFKRQKIETAFNYYFMFVGRI